MDDIQKNEPYSATNCFSKMAFLESERLLRNGEVRARLKFSEFLKNTREGLYRIQLHAVRKFSKLLICIAFF